MLERRRTPGRPRRADLIIPTKVTIMRCAAQLFITRGYRGVTMEMVAQASGVTKAAVYYHFHDKPSLVVAALRATLDGARAGTEQVLAQPMELRTQLEEIMRITLSIPYPFEAYEAMMREAATDLTPEQQMEIRIGEERIYRLITDAVEASVERGEICSDSPALVVQAYLALVRAGQARRPDGTRAFPDVEDTARRLTSMLWDGVAVRQSGRLKTL